jgi:Tfp pilus assembly protein PilN
MTQARQLASPTREAPSGGRRWRWVAAAVAVGAVLPLLRDASAWQQQMRRTEAAREILVVPAAASQSIDQRRRELNQALAWRQVLRSMQPAPEAALAVLARSAATLPEGVVLRRLEWRDGAWIGEGRARDTAAVRTWIRALSDTTGSGAAAPAADDCAARLLAESALADGSRAFSVAGGCVQSSGRSSAQASPASTPGPEVAADSLDTAATAGALAAVLGVGSAAWWRTRPGAAPWRIRALRRLLRSRRFDAWPCAASAVVAAEAGLLTGLVVSLASPWSAATGALADEEQDLRHAFQQTVRLSADALPAVDRRWLAAADGDPTDRFEHSLAAAVADGTLAAAVVRRGPWVDREFYREATHGIEIVGGFDAIGTELERALADPALRLAVVAFELAPENDGRLRFVATLRALRAPATP